MSKILSLVCVLDDLVAIFSAITGSKVLAWTEGVLIKRRRKLKHRDNKRRV